MAIGTAAAIIGGSIIAGGASLAAGSSSKKAINRATDASERNNVANNALAASIYNKNSSNISPFIDRGTPAGKNLNALLGLSTAEEEGRANDAFRQFVRNSDFAFQRDQGERGLGARLSALGGLESGAALKQMEGFRQNLQSGYRGEYMDMLAGQQNVGLSGANALAGVGTNMVGQVTANNNANTANIGNAAIARANVNSGMWNGVAGSIGNALGGFGSSFGSFGNSNAYGIEGSRGIY